MKIEISSNGIKLTAVPDESDLSKDKVFYVYEWFIKDTDQVFYIGKGKGDRFKQLDRRNHYFLKVKEHFDCDVRIVKEGLTEYEALVLEEEWFSQREKEGHNLTNIAVPNGVGANDLPTKYEYMITPIIRASRVDKCYFNKHDVTYDQIMSENLLKTHLHKSSFYGIAPLYLKTDGQFINQDETETKMKPIFEKVTDFIEKLGGKVYKSPAKSIKSLIVYSHITYESYIVFKQKGYDVYHLIDVLKYMER